MFILNVLLQLARKTHNEWYNVRGLKILAPLLSCSWYKEGVAIASFMWSFFESIEKLTNFLDLNERYQFYTKWDIMCDSTDNIQIQKRYPEKVNYLIIKEIAYDLLNKWHGVLTTLLNNVNGVD